MKKKWFYILLFSSLCVIAFCIIAVVFRIFTLPELPISFVAAFLEAVITAIITVVLLKGQTDAEEVKERNVKVFEIKSVIFQKYIDSMWEIWEKMEISAEKYREITKIFYHNIMLYLLKKSIKKISTCLLEIGNCMGKNQSDIYIPLRNNVFSIINELVKNMGLGGGIDVKVHSKIEQEMFLLLFKQTILEEMNNLLVISDIENSPLATGFYKTINDKEFYQELENREYILFPFKNEALFGCYMQIGPFTKNKDYKYNKFNNCIWLKMLVPSYRDEVAQFRSKEVDNYIDLEYDSNPVLLSKGLPYELIKSLGGSITNEDTPILLAFDDLDSIIKYNLNYINTAQALATRALIIISKLCITKIDKCSIFDLIRMLENISEEKKEYYAGLEIERLKKEGI
jgi:hypothetical protein